MQVSDRIVTVLGKDPVWSDKHGGMSGHVLRVTSASGVFYVKQGPIAVAEHERLRWLKRWASVPDIVAFDDDTLVLADVAAPSLASAAPPRIGTLMGQVLRDVHAIAISECPFNERLDVRLTRAAERVRTGLVDPDDFDDDHLGLSPLQVYDRLIAERPTAEDFVVAHGDYAPSNVLLPQVGNPVLIDVGGLGVADRYLDLAIAVRDLHDDFGPPAVDDFLAAYGLDTLDEQRLHYFRLLDEMF
ncbi:APH(3') family aminoglycoside O-phosphotransferase [Actinomadura alba]|uniref:Aminoglycoside 3'-phosphotransferase n=1 Tax=Actinomadura alba TaxID=406431 RepID=A0ABR7LIV3_9ACTN|nr:APH(3') family aminoglycoside O-phosphotransferase [Actinomadura alba]MBC6464762.1 aminoglycoside 3'-phosphotransferase [Actinomadura alba]